jgi:CRISPR-associated protein Cmr3
MDPNKPAEEAPRFWSAASTLAWLKQSGVDRWYKMSTDIGPPKLHEQARLHTEIQSHRRNVREHMLFRTTGLEFDFDSEFHTNPPNPERRRGRGPSLPASLAIFARIDADGDDWAETDGFSPFSGEQRMATWTKTDDLLPKGPSEWKPRQVRMQLVTPGKFKGGWKPDWVETGEPPGCSGLKMRLMAAAVRRFVPVSGFDMTKHTPGKPVQEAFRPTQFLAPAGSVYFFEVENGDASQLWLRSICDEEQDRRDGFGIALIGGWEWR